MGKRCPWDTIRHGIADLKLNTLSSGRLGIRVGDFDEAREQFMGVYLAGEVYRSTASFDRHWREPTSTRKPDEIDAAITVEFGLSLTELVEFLRATIAVGRDLEGERKVLEVGDFVDNVAGVLGWDRPRAERAFDLFAMRPRAKFQPPPALSISGGVLLAV